RLKDANHRRVLDEATRMRRQKRQLEALERDNFQDDPQANLVLVTKKLPQFDVQEGNIKKKKKTRGDHYKQRFRKNFTALLEEELMNMQEPSNYLSACVPPSTFPERKFCAVCGYPFQFNLFFLDMF
uniref:Zinc finger HIT domain-containing protein 1-like n=1 Tax=Saccoglossus kowalevskii TaxID=10224 RepID=A0ABM0GQH4_SACKO